MSDPKNLGKNIRKLRKEKKLNLKEFGKLLNVTDVSAARYETGAVDIPYSKLCHIADVLGTTPVELIEASFVSEVKNEVIPVLYEVGENPWSRAGIKETITADLSLEADFAVRVMEDGPLFKNGDMVFFRKTPAGGNIMALKTGNTVKPGIKSFRNGYFIIGENAYTSGEVEVLGYYTGFMRTRRP